MRIILLSAAVQALSADQAVDQISSSLQKALSYSPYSSIGIKLNNIIPKTIMDHYNAFTAIEKPTQFDLVSAIHASTVDIQLKTIEIMQHSLLKRDVAKANPGDQIALDLTDRREFLLNNDQYQKLAQKESELQDSAFDQQALDFENFLESLESKEPVNEDGYLDLLLNTVQVQLEKDTVENNLLENDDKLKELHTDLVHVDPNHKYLQLERSNELEKLIRQVSSARIILESFCGRIGIQKSTWNHLQALSTRMDRLITSNPQYNSMEKSPVAKELDRIIKSSPNPSKMPEIVIITGMIGIAAPPVLLAMFSHDDSND